MVVLSCLTLVTWLVLSSPSHFQSLSEKIEAQKYRVSQRAHGRAGLKHLCSRFADCFPGSVC